MRVIFLGCVLIVFVNAQYYERRYDYFNIDALIQNRRLLQKYMNCFLEKGPCPPVGRVFKERLPEVIRSGCAKCTPRQRVLARKAFDAFKREIPDDYIELRRKLDPQNQYYNDFERAISV